MGEYRRYIGLIGWCLLILVVIVLGTNIRDIRAGTSFIATELFKPGTTMDILMRVNIVDAAQIRAFPKEIGGWKSFETSTESLEKNLKSDVLLMREYY